MKSILHFFFIFLLPLISNAQYKASIEIDASKPGAAVLPALHGVFFEEISHGGEGGLYAELIQNRGFEESVLPHGTTLIDGFIVPDKGPMYNVPGSDSSDWKLEWPYKCKWPAWSLLKADNGMQLQLVNEMPLNDATPHSLKINVNKVGSNGLANEGFWGINIIKGDEYQLSFYARASKNFKGNITASLQSANGKILAAYQFKNATGSSWKKYTAVLKANQSDPKARFVLFFGSTGTVWLDVVSLFPAKTFMNRKMVYEKILHNTSLIFILLLCAGLEAVL